MKSADRGEPLVTEEQVDAALDAWRDAEGRLKQSINGDWPRLKAEAELQRRQFEKLSADYMMERIDALRRAEERRSTLQASTDEYHAAAKEELQIASDIWEAATIHDRDIPDHS
jgi:hypothetical protein